MSRNLTKLCASKVTENDANKELSTQSQPSIRLHLGKVDNVTQNRIYTEICLSMGHVYINRTTTLK